MNGLEGFPEFEAALTRMVAAVEFAAKETEHAVAYAVEARAKQNAPVVTGSLRRSIVTFPGSGGLGYMVAPTIIYSRRIELGFVGPDSLGRVYNQQPHPYFKPAVTSVIGRVGGMLRSRVLAAIRVA